MTEPNRPAKPTGTHSSAKRAKSFRPPPVPEESLPLVPERPLDHDILDRIVALMSGSPRYRDVERLREAVLFADVERGETYEIVVRPAEAFDEASDPPPSPIPGMVVATRLPTGRPKGPALINSRSLRAGPPPPRPKR